MPSAHHSLRQTSGAVVAPPLAPGVRERLGFHARASVLVLFFLRSAIPAISAGVMRFEIPRLPKWHPAPPQDFERPRKMCQLIGRRRLPWPSRSLAGQTWDAICFRGLTRQEYNKNAYGNAGPNAPETGDLGYRSAGMLGVTTSDLVGSGALGGYWRAKAGHSASFEDVLSAWRFLWGLLKREAPPVAATRKGPVVTDESRESRMGLPVESLARVANAPQWPSDLPCFHRQAPRLRKESSCLTATSLNATSAPGMM